MADSQTGTSETYRRPVIQGIGTCAVMPLIASGVGRAQDSFGSLDVRVQPWIEKEGRRPDSIDTDNTFEAKISVSGLNPPTNVAYMVAPFNSSDRFGDKERVHAQNREIQSESREIIHSNFNPSGFLHEWTEGEYRLFATVVDGNHESFGGAISDSFRIG